MDKLRIWGSGVRISSGAPVIMLKLKIKSSSIDLETNRAPRCGPYADPLERKERCGRRSRRSRFPRCVGPRATLFSSAKRQSPWSICANDVDDDGARLSRGRPTRISYWRNAEPLPTRGPAMVGAGSPSRLGITHNNSHVRND